LGKSHGVPANPRPVPYSREILASSFMASKSGAAGGNEYDNTIAAAAEKVEWVLDGTAASLVHPRNTCFCAAADVY